MFSFQDFWQLLLQYLTGKTILYSEKESLFKESTYNSTCGGRANGSYPCQDELAAFVLKIVAIASILVAGIAGISIPLMLSHFRYLRTNGNLFIAMKSFAEGVILATGCVHMLWDAIKALNNPCLPKHWTKFPFTGIFFMVGLVLTLLLDVVGNRYMEQKQAAAVVEDLENEGLFENGHDALITAHIEEQETETEIRQHGIVSVILELGIVSHSVIVGLSLGVSVNPYEIRPLIVALCFHQFFEGFALGGSISQARFNTSKAIVMACLFALTMPSGVGIGTWLALGYNPNSPGALVVEGVLDSLSAGILIYTAVNMIKADFGSNIMTSNSRLFITSFCMVLLGIGLMSSLAAWA